MKPMVRSLLLIVALAMSVPAAAQYWISVGSFRDPDTAQVGVQTLADRVTVPLTVTRYEAAGVYRVVMGPYDDMDSARQALSSARAGAVPDAWIVTESAGSQAPAAESPIASWTGTSSSSSVDIEALLRLARAPMPEPSPIVPTQDQGVAAPAEPVTTAPDGYQLHMLRRTDSR